MAYTPQVWNNGPGGATPLDAARLNYMEGGIAAALVGMEVVAPVTANGNLALNTYTPANASGGAISALVLPTGKVTDCIAVVKTDSSVNTVTLTGSVMGSSGTVVLNEQNEVTVLISDASHSWWPLTNAPGSGGGGGATPSVTKPVRVANYYASESPGSPPTGAATIDGYNVNTGDRVLVMGTLSTYDGIWIANTSGPWTQPTDWTNGNIITDGTLIPVAYEPGSLAAGSIWVCTSAAGDFTVGTDQAIFFPCASAESMVTPNLYGVDTALGQGANFIAGALGFQPITHTGTYAMQGNEQPLIFGNGAITLPNPGTFDKVSWTFKDNGAGTLVVHPHGAETIDGASTLTFSPYQAKRVWSNGTNWFTIV